MNEEKPPSLIGMLALLGLAAAIAFLDHRGGGEAASSTKLASDKPATSADALAPGHGRHATSPTRIPPNGWKDIFWRTYDQINEDRLLAVAAGVVFYALLALFPAVTALVSSYALFVDQASINEHMGFLAGFLPEGTFSIVQDQVNRVLSKGDIKLGWAFAFSLVLALWSANGGMKAVLDALNVVYDEKEKRGFVTLNAVSLAFTIGAVLAILAASTLVIAAPIAIETIGFGTHADLLIKFGRWPVLAILLLSALAILYRYGPSRRSPKWRWISVGSLVGTLTWMAGSALLSFYLSNFGHYDATYGSLGAIMALMIWMWMSLIVVLFAAELNSEIEHQTIADSTDGSAKPLGARGAQMADSVGASR